MLEDLRLWVRSQYNGPPLVIKGLWNIDCNYQPGPVERKFAYKIIVAQTTGQGACYYDGPTIPNNALAPLVGQSYAYQATSFTSLDIALLDSVASSNIGEPDQEVLLAGDSEKKAEERARLIVTEVNRLVCQRIHNSPVRVCNVGVVSLVIAELLKKGFAVTATDMDPAIVGKRLFDQVTVRPADETIHLVAKSDIAVVTGMTLANGSLAAILYAALNANTNVVLFAQTGSGFAPFYLERGISTVIAEPFPFYIYNGNTFVRVFRRTEI